MAWCSHCSGDRPISADEQLMNSPDGTRKRRRRLFASCSACGRVLKDRSLRSLDKALAAIQDIATNALNINTTADATSNVIGDAQDLLRSAMEREELFARGRRTRTHVAAACLYVSLRRHRRPYMLIDLSDYLKVAVYVLGAVLVALCRILRIKNQGFEEEEEDLCNSTSSPFSSCFVIDPSLFMHRISTRLLGRKDSEVASTALRILSRTNQKQRGWMLSRQKQIPVRICSAALYIAAIANTEDDVQGHKFSMLEVARTVRDDFVSMESVDDGLAMDEFVSRAADMTIAADVGGGELLVCQHKKSSRPHCRHGLCKECYDVFVRIAGGSLERSAESPAFQTARRNKIRREREMATASESLSDDEDFDINVYLNTEKEKQYKTMIWELMNNEYLEEKSRAAAATGNKPRKERKQRRRAGDNNNNNTRGSEEMMLLPDKRVSSRINYDVLTRLNGEETQEKEKQQQEIETDRGDGMGNGEKNEEEEGFDIQGMEDDNEAEVDGDGKSAVAEGDDYYGDFEEDYGEGGYSEYYDEFADVDDFGF